MRTRRELEQRKWEYSVLEQLLEHLRQLSNPVLQKLAITAAEVALGRELTELRAGLETARAHAAFAEMAAPPRSVLERGAPAGTREESQPEGIFPTIPGIFYSCSDIGARAGGFSARAAGMAANSVASRRGITPEELRAGRRFRVEALQGEVERLRVDPLLQGEVEITEVQGNFDFVQVYTKMDAFGQPRKMFAFDAEFANEVIRELRAKFTPQRLELGPDPNLDFGQRKSYPKLSRGPFEDDDELSPGP